MKKAAWSDGVDVLLLEHVDEPPVGARQREVHHAVAHAVQRRGRRGDVDRHDGLAAARLDQPAQQAAAEVRGGAGDGDAGHGRAPACPARRRGLALRVRSAFGCRPSALGLRASPSGPARPSCARPSRRPPLRRSSTRSAPSSRSSVSMRPRARFSSLRVGTFICLSARVTASSTFSRPRIAPSIAFTKRGFAISSPESWLKHLLAPRTDPADETPIDGHGALLAASAPRSAPPRTSIRPPAPGRQRRARANGAGTSAGRDARRGAA